MLDMIMPALKVKISGDLFERLVFKTLSIFVFVCFFFLLYVPKLDLR